MQTTITFTYSAPGETARGEPAMASGGARVTVSPAALTAIRSLVVDDDGRLPMSARGTLARIDDREGHSTELAVLLRALQRRDVFIR